MNKIRPFFSVFVAVDWRRARIGERRSERVGGGQGQAAGTDLSVTQRKVLHRRATGAGAPQVSRRATYLLHYFQSDWRKVRGSMRGRER